MDEIAARALLAQLRRRGVRRVRRVRLRANRDRLLSISRDGTLLNAHVCFGAAPPDILDAIATFLRTRAGSPDSRRAVAALRAWPGAVEALHRARACATREPGPGRVAVCCGTPAQRRFVRALYARLNRTHFGGGLPRALPIRLSNRMETRYGHVRYDVAADGRRAVVEIALNVDLMLEGNEGDLVETLLHEMAHVEVWLVLGHRGHGRPWKRIARRVGCEPRACAQKSLKRRRRRELTVTRVPGPAPWAEPRREMSQIDLFERVA